MPQVLSELNQQWRAHTQQHNEKEDASIAALVGRLLPHIRSTSQQKAFVRIARRSEQKPQDNTAWATHLNHQQTEIKQLIEAIDMTRKARKPHGINHKKAPKPTQTPLPSTMRD